MRTVLLVASAFFSVIVAQGQSRDTVVLTLDECIEIALDRNNTLKRAKNEELIARANRFQAIMNFFPTLNAGANYDFFFGNFFDTNAARQVSATTSSSNPNINSSLTLFNGFSNHYNMRRRENELTAAQQSIDGTRISVESDILTNYLNVIRSQENLKISLQRIDLLSQQLDRAKKRESVGVGSMEDVYNFQSQLANEKLQLTNSKNEVKRNKLLLLQSMQIDITEAVYEVATVNIESIENLQDLPPFDDFLNEVLSVMPTVLAAKSTLDASRYGMKAASANRMPSITVSGALGSNYSSNGARNPETGEFEPNATVAEQLTYNEFEYVNFRLSIPIFQNYQRTTNYQVAKINLANAEIGVNEAINSVTNAVQQAYLDYSAAQEVYQSSIENLEALEQSFFFMKKRYELGNSDFYNYLESLNNKNRAELQLVNAKYSMIFRKKVLDLYRSL
jgi:outer membrane protein